MMCHYFVVAANTRIFGLKPFLSESNAMSRKDSTAIINFASTADEGALSAGDVRTIVTPPPVRVSVWLLLVLIL